MGAQMTEEKLKQAAKRLKAKACYGCPRQSGITAEITAGVDFRKQVESVRVRIKCGAVNDQEVKPPVVTCYTKCKRYNRAV